MTPILPSIPCSKLVLFALLMNLVIFEIETAVWMTRPWGQGSGVSVRNLLSLHQFSGINVRASSRLVFWNCSSTVLWIGVWFGTDSNLL